MLFQMCSSLNRKDPSTRTKCQYFFRDAETANNVSNNHTNNAGAPGSPQKPGGFRLFQSSNNNSSGNQPQQQSSVNSAAQPNGILKNSYDREAMSRVGQR